LPQDPILGPEAAQLLPFLRRQTVRSLSAVEISLLQPCVQRLVRDPEVLRNLSHSLPRLPDQTDGFLSELLRIRRSKLALPSHLGGPPLSLSSSNDKVSAKPGPVHRRASSRVTRSTRFVE
jgi:hypothetical protein